MYTFPRQIIRVLGLNCTLNVDSEATALVKAANDDVSVFFLCAGQRRKTKYQHLVGFVAKIVQFSCANRAEKLADFFVEKVAVALDKLLTVQAVIMEPFGFGVFVGGICDFV